MVSTQQGKRVLERLWHVLVKPGDFNRLSLYQFTDDPATQIIIVYIILFVWLTFCL